MAFFPVRIHNVRYSDEITQSQTANTILALSEDPGLTDGAFRLLALLHKEANERLKVSRVPQTLNAAPEDLACLVSRGWIDFEAADQQKFGVVLYWQPKPPKDET